MFNVLTSMHVIRWIAKEIHYNSKGECFYAQHLLADKVDFGSLEDELKEAYYLGYLEQLPPTEEKINTSAIDFVRTSEYNVRYLYDCCTAGVYVVEEAKREAGLPGGVHSILDGISQKMLTYKGLCWRILNGAETTKSA